MRCDAWLKENTRHGCSHPTDCPIDPPLARAVGMPESVCPTTGASSSFPSLCLLCLAPLSFLPFPLPFPFPFPLLCSSSGRQGQRTKTEQRTSEHPKKGGRDIHTAHTDARTEQAGQEHADRTQRGQRRTKCPLKNTEISAFFWFFFLVFFL
jgi:hypothetical protein